VGFCSALSVCSGWRAKGEKAMAKNSHAKEDGGIFASFGQILYWVGCIVAVAIIAGGVFLVATDAAEKADPTRFEDFVGAALIIWLIGRASRYILSKT